MRRIAADYMISGGVLSRDPLIEVDDNGVIVSVLCNVQKPADAEYFEGLLIPGMVNLHSHLEYSYIDGKIPQGGGLPHFISSIIKVKREDRTSEVEMIAAAERIDSQMFTEGVVAVGDHNNNDFVMSVKRASGIYYHTFIELFGLGGDDNTLYHNGLERRAAHEKLGLRSSITPHACYSMSDQLLTLAGADSNGGVVSIHYKESLKMGGEEESQRIFSALSTGNSSVILVHGIYATEEEIERAQTLYGERVIITVSPLSNHYIEAQMADLDMLRRRGVRIGIGTDSLSSNTTISMVSEMVKITQLYPEIPLPEIVDWATINGARALGIDSWAGTIEVGKRPRIVNISGFDGERLTAQSRGIALR